MNHGDSGKKIVGKKMEAEVWSRSLSHFFAAHLFASVPFPSVYCAYAVVKRQVSVFIRVHPVLSVVKKISKFPIFLPVHLFA